MISEIFVSNLIMSNLLKHLFIPEEEGTKVFQMVNFLSAKVDKYFPRYSSPRG